MNAPRTREGPTLTGADASERRMTVHPLIVSVSATLGPAILGGLAVSEAVHAVHGCASNFERAHGGQPVEPVKLLASDPQRTHPVRLGHLRHVGSLVGARRHRPTRSRKQ